MELFKLLGTIAVENSDANKAIDDTTDKAEGAKGKMSGAFSKIGQGAVAVGKTIGAGLAVGAAAMTGLTTKALSMAGDLEQNMGGSEAVFKDCAGKMQDTAKTAFSNMGLSASDFLGTANKMGALFQGAGFSIQESSELSASAMQRAADVASIMGISTEDAMEAVAGAAKGNFTMMDNLGVAMNDTAIQNYALSKGINKTTAEMTQQEKIGLAMEMFMDKTAYAAGNYAKENETLAGSLGTAKSALSNFLSGAGTVDDVVSSFSNAANVIVKNLNDLVPKLVNGITSLVKQIVPLLPPLLQSLLPGIIEGAVQLINGLVAAIPMIITALLDALPAIIDGIMQIFNALVAALPQIMQVLCDALPTLIPQIINALITMLLTLMQFLPQIIQPIIDNLPEIIISIVTALMDNLPALIEGCIQLVIGIVQAIPQIILALIEALPTVISSIVEGLFQALPALIMGIIQLIGEIGKAIWEILKGFVTSLGQFFSGLWESIKTIFQPVIDFFGNLFSGAWEAIKNVWSAVTGFFSGIWDGISKAFAGVGDFFKNMFSGAWDGIKNVWNAVTGFFSNIWKGISNTFSGVGDFFKNIFQGAYNGITGIFSKIGGFFKDVFGALGNIIKAPVNLVIRGLNFLINGLNKVGFDVPDWVPVIGGKRFGFSIPNIPELAKGGVLEKGQTGYLEGDGAEAVVPLEQNTGWIKNIANKLHDFSIQNNKADDAVPVGQLSTIIRTEIGQRIGNLETMLASVVEILKEFFPQLLDAFDVTMVMDDGTLVAKLTPKIDRQLGVIYKRKERG